MQYAITAGILTMIAFSLMLYFTLRTSSKDVSDYSPLKEVLTNEVILKRKVVLIENYEHYVMEHPFIIKDSLDSYIDEGVGMGDLKLVGFLPEGTKIKLQKARMFNNGVSGSDRLFLIGEVDFKGQRYPFEYEWGNESISKRFDNIAERWSFPMAPWQQAQDTVSYALPSGR